MDYRRVYCKIIKKAQSENRSKTSGIYYERHHILPKSIFPLWKNKASNIVLLTIREHLFCHKLLVKIYPSWQMGCALALMLSVERYHCKESDKVLIKKFFNRPEPWNKGLNYFDIFTEDERIRTTDLIRPILSVFIVEKIILKRITLSMGRNIQMKVNKK